VTSAPGTPATALAFWVVRPGVGAIREEVLPPRGDGEVLVRAQVSGVSRGTEALVFSGRVPESEYLRMRCPRQAGDFPTPVKYGYSSVGVVVEGPEALRGRTVFCLHPHQSAYVVPASAVVPVPDGVPAERAVLAANMETALNAIWDARLRAGDLVTVVGGGVVGCLVAYLASQLPGAEVELVELNPVRQSTASALGIGFAHPHTASRERDAVLHASGTQAGLRTALSLAAKDATVVELSWFGAGEVALPLGEDFHSRRLTLRGSQVGTVSPEARPRFTHETRLALALSLLEDPALDVLLEGPSAFASLPETMAELVAGSGALCHLVRF
jgi:NADPH:quinone reductase-like Zn-dependent oxidoreductase